MIHVSRQHRALVVPSRADIAALFPHANKIQFEGQDMLALPHGLQETQMLRNLGLPAPAPISEHYHFPGPNPPYDVQVRTTALMTTAPRAYVLNKMGTGKTRCGVWAFDWLHRNKDARKMLVVAPLSTLNFVWGNEILKTLHGARIKVLTGPRERRLKLLAEDADIYIINHDGLAVIEHEIQARRDIDVVLIDEIGAYRNARATRSKVMQRVAANRAWAWGFTGSPTPQAPTDAYGIAKVLTPAKAPSSFTRFRQETMMQFGPFTWKPRKDAAQIVANLLQPAVCYSLDDVLELPELIERTVDVEQGPRQKAAYKELKDHASVMLREGSATAANGGVVLNKMLQTSCGYVYLDNGGSATLDNHERLETMLDLVEGTEGKTIIFCPFINAVEGVAEKLKVEKIDFAIVHGDTPKAERDRIFQAFQFTSGYRVIVAHPGCMSHGLTLTAADTIIWFAPIASLETFEQANARIRRIGQTRKQQILMLQGTGAEKASYDRLRHRRDAQASVLELLAELVE